MADGINQRAYIADKTNWQDCCGTKWTCENPGLWARQKKQIDGAMENLVVYMTLRVGIGVGIFFTPRQRWIALHGNRRRRKKWMNAYKRKCVQWGRRELGKGREGQQ